MIKAAGVAETEDIMKPKHWATGAPANTGEAFIPTHSGSNWKDIFFVVAVAWAARLLFMLLMPPGARSFDSFSWEHQALLLKTGVNPYQANGLFNWPPFWMQCVFIISKIADFLHVPFFRVLQVVLILFETAVIIETVRLIRMLAPAANVRALVIIGIALNPIAILLICQHCNFDVIMAMWLLLAISSLIRYNVSDNLSDWLSACLFLGLGILTKTVPLALVPLLAGGYRKASASRKLVGAALVLGPVTLGMSIIYVLSPEQVTHNVLGYRGQPLSSGFTGLLHMMGREEFSSFVSLAYYILGIGIMALTWHHLWTRHSLRNPELVLYTGLMLLAIPGLSLGVGGQYFYWFLPFLVITYACYPGIWQKLLIGFGIISVITFIISYGLIPAYGYNFLFLLSHTTTQEDLYSAVQKSHDAFFMRVVNWSYQFGLPGVETLESLPLFIAGIVLLVFGTRILLNTVDGLRKKWVLGLVGFYALYIFVIFGTAVCLKCFGSGNNAPSDSNLSQTNH